MQETVRVMEQRFEEKVKEVLTLLSDLEVQKKIVAEKNSEIAHFQDRINEMEDQMRRFTSLANTSKNDETFESVLRAEFENMRRRLTSKNDSLACEVQNLRADLIR